MPVDLEKVKALLDEPHVIDLRDDGFTIRHPLSCRPELFTCPLWQAARAALAAPPPFRGRYQCEIADDGMFTIGDLAARHLDDIDIAALVDELEATRAAGDQLRAVLDDLVSLARRGTTTGPRITANEVDRAASRAKQLLGAIQSPPAPVGEGR